MGNRILSTLVKVIKVTKRRIEHNTVTTKLWKEEGKVNTEDVNFHFQFW